MAEKAHVTSVEALDAFRASLILYVSKARPTLEEASADVLRTRLWLQNDQRLHWENQVRRRAKALEQAQQELASARLSNLRDEKSAEQNAVRKARQALDEAEAKLKLLKQWNREFDNRVEPLVKQLEKLHTVLANDMVQAAAYLAQAVNTLSAYAEMSSPSSPTPAKQETTASAATPGGAADALPSRQGIEAVPKGDNV
jgi:chromosome segregation ATPase